MAIAVLAVLQSIRTTGGAGGAPANNLQRNLSGDGVALEAPTLPVLSILPFSTWRSQTAPPTAHVCEAGAGSAAAQAQHLRP